ncbi:MAG: radical SAM protein [Thermodesulfobacteriota bacterium]
MKCLLINPFYPISETPSPPLGLAYLAAVLERAGVEVALLDFVVFPYSREALAEKLRIFSPDFVGLTAVTMSFDQAAQIVRDVKSLAPGLLTVMGGPHVSMCASDTLANLPELDMVAVGEGDETIVRLAAELAGGRRWETVPGIVYRDKAGAVCATPVKEYAVDVKALPLPARHLLPLGRYKALNMPVSMTTSRGCPFKCIFCVGRKMVGARVRYRDPISVVDELEYLMGLGFPQINIADDLFTASRAHCFGVCDEIERRGLKVKWSSFARVDLVSLDLLQRMKQAGCVAVSFGVETANPDILKTIKKGITIAQVEAAVTACAEAGMLPHVSFILGLPGETPETIEETKAFGEKLKALGASYGFHLLAPFPGTEVRDRAGELGIRILTHDWREYHANKAIVETEKADAALMDRVAGRWKDEYDEYLGHVQRLIEAGTATDEEAWALIGLENTVMLYDLMMKSSLEDKGAWPAKESTDADPNALLADLAGRVCGFTDYPAERVARAMQWAIDRGCLAHRVEEGRIVWAWKDYL